MEQRPLRTESIFLPLIGGVHFTRVMLLLPLLLIIVGGILAGSAGR